MTGVREGSELSLWMSLCTVLLVEMIVFPHWIALRFSGKTHTKHIQFQSCLYSFIAWHKYGNINFQNLLFILNYFGRLKLFCFSIDQRSARQL